MTNRNLPFVSVKHFRPAWHLQSFDVLLAKMLWNAFSIKIEGMSLPMFSCETTETLIEPVIDQNVEEKELILVQYLDKGNNTVLS